MIAKFNAFFLSITMIVVCFNLAFSQESSEKSDKSIERRYAFFNLRGSNAIDIAAGSAMVDGDYSENELDVYFKIGYKHYITSHLNVKFSYNKYNLVVRDIYNRGFMSFDLNLEFLFSPYTKFSPFLFAGGGYSASNYFENTAIKSQGGAGFELIFTEGIGVKLFGEYNYLLTDELDGLVGGESNDLFYRVGLGLNFYFGGNKKKEALRRKMKTVINSNQIIPYK